jgi:hypothetical protein
MIHMPQRSVTRFFIPLIDVLLLLFSIFLLMPAFKGAEGVNEEGGAKMSEEDLADQIRSLKRELKNLQEYLQQVEKYRDPLRELKKVQAERDRLLKEKEQALKRPTFVRVIDIDGKTGKITFYDDANLENPVFPIPDQKAATELIARHQKEAGKRFLYYQFMFPRKDTGWPRRAQTDAYRSWFDAVANSLKKEKLP